MRYRHGIIHSDEIWENGKFIKLTPESIKKDIEYIKEFISNINDEFRKKIGVPSEIKWLKVKVEQLKDERIIKNCEECPLGSKFDKNFITCFYGAYDGIGFGVEKKEWKNTPFCDEITYTEAFRQRKWLGEGALFNQIHFIPVKDKAKKKRKTK